MIAERRITFAKIGKHVRIDSADLDAFVAAGRVDASGNDLMRERSTPGRRQSLPTASGES